nr:unnamed protein product [Digitaria exilis]
MCVHRPSRCGLTNETWPKQTWIRIGNIDGRPSIAPRTGQQEGHVSALANSPGTEGAFPHSPREQSPRRRQAAGERSKQQDRGICQVVSRGRSIAAIGSGGRAIECPAGPGVLPAYGRRLPGRPEPPQRSPRTITPPRARARPAERGDSGWHAEAHGGSSMTRQSRHGAIQQLWKAGTCRALVQYDDRPAREEGQGKTFRRDRDQVATGEIQGGSSELVAESGKNAQLPTLLFGSCRVAKVRVPYSRLPLATLCLYMLGGSLSWTRGIHMREVATRGKSWMIGSVAIVHVA